MFNSTLEETYSVEAALLSLIINAGDNGLFLRAYEHVAPEHFADPFHQRLFKELQQMVLNRSVLIDKTLLQAKIKQPEYKQKFERILAEHTSLENFSEYLHTIKRAYQTRKFKSILLDMTVRTQQESEGDPVTWVSSLEDQLLTIVSDNAGTFASPKDIMPEIFRQFAEGKHEAPLKIPIPDLNSMLFGIHPGYYVVAARPSMGKAQPLDAGILMADGSWKQMRDVSVGDRLASIDGQESIVDGIFPQGSEDVVEITFSDGRSTQCSLGHLWKVYNRKWNESKTLTTQEIIDYLDKPSYEGRIYIDTFDGIYGEEVDVGIDPYVLGILIGDGNLNQTSIRFSTADEDVLKNVEIGLPENHRIVHAGNYDYRITSSEKSNKILNAIRYLGLASTSQYKFIPEEMFSATYQQRLDLLCGLMDSDGWTETHGSYRFSTSSSRLAFDVQRLARSLGFIVSNPSCHKTSCLDSYRITMSHGSISPFRLDRKVRTIEVQRERRLSIASIERVGNVQTQCIHVTHPEHLYITDGYTVTHNTAFVMDWAVHNAIRGYRTLVFSLEMDQLSLTNRIIANVAEVPHFAVRSRDVSPEQFAKIKNAEETISSLKIEIDDSPGISVHELAARAKRYKIKHPDLAMIVVDYIQLLAEGGSGGTREGEVRQMSQVLKNLGRALGVPIVVLSQLSRKVEERQDKRPIMSDLRDSGSLEQDADVVIFLYADSYYDHQRKGFTCWDTEIIVSKHRNGPVGIVPSVHNKDFQKFEPPGGNREDDEGIKVIFTPEETEIEGINVTHKVVGTRY